MVPCLNEAAIRSALLARQLVQEERPGGLWDRQGNHFLIFDIDGTREAARQRALPQPEHEGAVPRTDAPGYVSRQVLERALATLEHLFARHGNGPNPVIP